MSGMSDMSMGDDGSVTLAADQIRTFGVTFGTVAMRTLENNVRTVGVVALDETRVVQVASKIGGFVELLYADFTGQPVRSGQPLLELYSPDFLSGQQELLLAAQLEESLGRSGIPGVPSNATNLVAAAKRRFALWDVSEAQVDEVLRTGRTRRTMTMYAPASGIVTEKRVVRGQSVMPGEQLYTIADLSRVWVETQLREVDMASVRVGSEADIEFAGFPGRPFKGRVEYVYPTVEREARTVRARVVVTNTDGLVKPGMYATVRLSTPARMALTVPTSAVVRTGERTLVFVDMGEGQLMPHEVELGRAGGDYTEVLAGVELGQRAVTSAQFLIDSESNLAEVMRSMIGSGMGGDTSDMAGMEMGGAEMKDKGADMRGMPGMKPSSPPARPRR
ncbi:MAG: efflux RND transporter periplasmic adaptor subunit [Gemmatimonadaceae bacterium]